MENDSAFKPVSPCFAFSATTVATSPIQLTSTQGGSPQSGSEITAKILNSGTVATGVCYGPTAAFVTANCVIPTPGTPQQILMLSPGEDGTFTVPPGQFWSVITTTGTATVYIQTGLGI